MVTRRWFYLGLILLMAVVALGCNKGPAPKEGGAPPDGASGRVNPNAVTPPAQTAAAGAVWTGNAQDFSVKGFDGKEFKISDYAGQPVVLNFWAAWCPPCVGEFPEFQTVYNAKKGQFVMISVAVDTEADPVKFVQDKGYNWIFAHDTDGSKKYNVSSIPQTFFIDRTGQILDSKLGGMSGEEFEAMLSKIL